MITIHHHVLHGIKFIRQQISKLGEVLLEYEQSVIDKKGGFMFCAAAESALLNHDHLKR